MKRRWIIRSIFILPILLCIVGWGWSAGHSGDVWYWTGVTGVSCSTGWGSVGVCTIYSRVPDWEPGWHCEVVPTDEIRFLFGAHLGFVYSSTPIYTHVYVPYWFLILVFSAVLLFVWRKTRKPNHATAFPVEMDKMPK